MQQMNIEELIPQSTQGAVVGSQAQWYVGMQFWKANKTRRPVFLYN